MLSKLRVAGRIYSGFGLILVILAVLSAISLFTFLSIQASMLRFETIAENAVRVANIKASVGDVRRNVLMHLEMGNDKSGKRVHELNQQLTQQLQLAISVTSHPERLANLKRMDEQFRSYYALYQKGVGLAERKGQLVNGHMNPLGQEARKNMSAIVESAMADQDFEAAALAGQAEEALMMGRLSAVRFLADPKQDTQQAAQDRLEKFVDLSEKLVKRLRNPNRKHLAEQAEQDARAYEAAFREVASATFALHDLLFKDMTAIGIELSSLADQTGESQEKSLNQIMADTAAEMLAAKSTTLIAASVALLLGVVIAVLIARSIVRPVQFMTGVMGQLAQNNLSVEVPFADQTDEIGEMAQSVAHFKNQMIRVRQLEADQEEQKKRAEADRKAAMNHMADTFEDSVGQVVNTVTSAVTELQASASQMASTATETSTQATTVASSAEEASSNVQTVASATEELSSSINEIAHQVERSLAVAGRAEEEARHTTDMVENLSEAVGKIGEIVSLINAIAHQTNLLALNATIEAARAGEAGKGFAVVANEVKGLAAQTAKATGEITSHIHAVQQGTSNAVQAIDSISKVIGEMSEISASVASAVQEQTAATNEIARNVEQASQGTQAVTASVVVVEEAARDTGAAAEQIRASATELSQQAEYLRGEVGRFLAQVRSDKSNMKLVQWSSDYVTGNSRIDAHHQGFFEDVNRFYGEMMAGDGGAQAIAILNGLEKRMQEHFGEEEELMQRAGYPGLSTHRDEHRRFVSKVTELKRGVESNQQNAAQELFTYLADWLRQHIMKSDMAAIHYLKK